MSIDKMLVFVNLDDVKYLDDQDIVQFLVKSERSIMRPKKLLCSMTMTMTKLILFSLEQTYFLLNSFPFDIPMLNFSRKLPRESIIDTIRQKKPHLSWLAPCVYR